MRFLPDTGAMVRARRGALALALALGASGTTIGPRAESLQRAALEQSVDLMVVVPPAVLNVAGARYLGYELHVTNMRREPVALERVAVFGDTAPSPIADLAGDELTQRLGRPGFPRTAPDPQLIGPGQRSVVYFWFGVPPTLPRTVTHGVTVSFGDSPARRRLEVRSRAVDVSEDRPVPIAPPLAAGPWVAIYDPLLMGGHRTTFITVDGAARIPARFAIDWIRAPATAGGTAGTPNSEPDRNGFGAHVLAVADAGVAAARDGLPDLPPGVSRPAQSPPLDEESGNYVILEIAARRYVVYEHLRQGSVRVRVGQRIRRGEPIAELGSSGSTSIGPHLHFHVADARDTLAAEGMPFALTRFTLLGAYPGLDQLGPGGAWQPVAADVTADRRGEHPPSLAVVRFP